MREDAISDRCADCGHPASDHDADGCAKCDCFAFVKPLQGGNHSMADTVEPQGRHNPKN
jgi:hypothetical protein